MNETVVRVVADPALPEQPTAGPWLITCSTCGPVGVAVTTIATDLAIVNHYTEHAVALA